MVIIDQKTDCLTNFMTTGLHGKSPIKLCPWH